MSNKQELKREKGEGDTGGRLEVMMSNKWDKMEVLKMKKGEGDTGGRSNDVQ